MLGPLGTPSHIERFGTCVLVAGGIGAAIVLPVAEALAEAGYVAIGIVGVRDSEHLVLLDEMRAACNEVIVTTDDGSEGLHGLVTEALVTLMAETAIDYVFTAGPIPMMQAVAERTRQDAIATVASLNPLMVDGTGMCGGCRVAINGASKFACIDGPEFDAHDVNFALLGTRTGAYLSFESCKLDEAVEALDA